MTTPDAEALRAQAQKMQSKVADLQKKLAAQRVEGSAGGGMVTVVADGQLRIIEVRIEPALFEGGDHQMLQDLTAAAVNSALAAAQRMVQEEFQRAAGTFQFAAGPGPTDGAGG